MRTLSSLLGLALFLLGACGGSTTSEGAAPRDARSALNEPASNRSSNATRPPPPGARSIPGTSVWLTELADFTPLEQLPGLFHESGAFVIAIESQGGNFSPAFCSGVVDGLSGWRIESRVDSELAGLPAERMEALGDDGSQRATVFCSGSATRELVVMVGGPIGEPPPEALVRARRAVQSVTWGGAVAATESLPFGLSPRRDLWTPMNLSPYVEGWSFGPGIWISVARVQTADAREIVARALGGEHQHYGPLAVFDAVQERTPISLVGETGCELVGPATSRVDGSLEIAYRAVVALGDDELLLVLGQGQPDTIAHWLPEMRAAIATLHRR